MENKKYYTDQLTKYKNRLKQTKAKLLRLAILRMTAFAGAGATIYLLHPNYKLSVPIAAVLLVAFVKLIFVHNDTKRIKKFFERIVDFNENELKVIEAGAYHMPDGERYKNPEHPFSQDLDLFGHGSFFQFINRSSTKEGEEMLANRLTSNNLEHISEKQEIIKNLAQHPEFIQKFSSHGSSIECETSTEEITNWLSNYQPFMKSWNYIFAIIFSICSIGIIAATGLGLIGFSWINLWIGIGIVLIAIYLKKTSSTAAFTNRIGEVFSQYANLALLIEEEEFENEHLLNKISIFKNGKSASVILKKFSKRLDAINNRNNLLIGLFGNGLFLYDYLTIYKMEKWIVANRADVKEWFDCIHDIDALNSFGLYSFNHPDHVYPTVEKSVEYILNIENGAHPLIDKNKRVHNSYSINKNHFDIVTGANMAGKSTFLRFIGLSVVLANNGLPICAEKVNYSPIKLVTSMRTVDSLDSDESFFFSELKRLKFIVDLIKEDQYFILLDEILKGTNSKDKAEGSAKFLKKLVELKSNGIIATHDLSLCTLDKDYNEISNKCFEAQINNDELTFDYKLNEGICTNMNASFLLKKMQLVD